MEEVVLKFDASLILRRISDDQVARARLARASSRCSQVFDHHGTVRLDIKVLVHNDGLVKLRDWSVTGLSALPVPSTEDT